MWKKLLITGCMAFCLLGGSVLSAQPSCETKEEVTSEQLNRTKTVSYTHLFSGRRKVILIQHWQEVFP